ncbi:hypothetical protein EW146_g1957 [Bondarzewia mesenterica]|uniref:DUF7223 domain-containing protein n=1 Tax=Bondarzewia mesenterica TaxID=1095465 RepID=A0A4S4M251_9AGAM|nr:hypothetical protein EW146_g1957 [Bondarzewia mesenterica]
MRAFALNDWTTPCFHGECAYDLGASTAISDITEAAGWAIIECDRHAMAQDIRLVCMSDDAATSGCDHLLLNGAEGKIVRLPDSCAEMPFARVARSYIPSDQSIPSSLRKRLSSRDGARQPLVYALSLDSNFSQTNPAGKGNVSFSAQGISQSGPRTTFLAAGPSHPLNPSIRVDQRRNDIMYQKRFNEANNLSFPIDIDEPLNVLNTTIGCPADSSNPDSFSAHMSVGLNATMNGSLHLDANVEGSYDSGRITVFEIPSIADINITIPGILTIGPTFKVDAEFIAGFELAIDLNVSLAYTAQNAFLVFPPDHGASGGMFGPSDNSLSIAANPSLQSDANVTTHLIPTIEFEIFTADNETSASIYLALDTFASLSLKGDIPTNSSNCGGSNSSVPSVQGCVDLSTGFIVSAGADANFFNLFDPSTEVTLFNSSFDLFNQCFNASSLTNSTSAKTKREPDTLSKRGLACPTDLLPTTTLTKKVVKAAEQKERIASPNYDVLSSCSGSNSQGSSSSDVASLSALTNLLFGTLWGFFLLLL